MSITSHVHELRISLAICLSALLVASTVAYIFFQPILKFFQAPLNQQLYYTSPAGGFTFAIKLCLAVGIVVAIPVLVNRIFSFAKPTIPKSMQRAFAWYSVCSVLLAVAGIAFAYYISLPSALHFLTNFNKDQIQALITVDSYFSFVITYLIGYALLFQTPIIMLFINRVKPLDPGSMMKVQRYVVLGSFIVAALLTPTPDPWNQLLMALPIIFLYQIGMVAVWSINRRRVLVYARASDGPIKAKIPNHLVSEQLKPIIQNPLPELVAQPIPVVTTVQKKPATAVPVQVQEGQEYYQKPRVFDIISTPRTA